MSQAQEPTLPKDNRAQNQNGMPPGTERMPLKGKFAKVISRTSERQDHSADFKENQVTVSVFANHDDRIPKQGTSPSFEAFAQELLAYERVGPCTVDDCAGNTAGQQCPHKNGLAVNTATYKPDATRNKEGVDEITMLSLDFDKKTEQEIAYIEAALAPYTYVLDSTHGHRGEDSRWSLRGYVAIAKPVRVEGPEWWQPRYEFMLKTLGVAGDLKCKDPCRLMYAHSRPIGAPRYSMLNHGVPIDLHKILESYKEAPKPVITVAPITAHTEEKLKRASEYLATMDPAISGQDGSGKLFRAACMMIHGFDLTPDQAFSLLWSEYNPRCLPPWSEKEMRHKVSDADKEEDGQGRARGYKLAEKSEKQKAAEAYKRESADIPATKKATAQEPGQSVPGLAVTGAEVDSVAQVEEEQHIWPVTDTGNAERLEARYKDTLRYCREWKKWLAYKNGSWQPDKKGMAREASIATARLINKEAICLGQDTPEGKAYSKWAHKSESRGALDNMLAIAQDKLPITTEDLDKDLYLLNVANGTINLRTGQLREHRKEDYLTQQSPVVYDPKATAHRFLQFLSEAMADDPDMIAFLKRAIGYSLTGDVTEQVLFFCWGDGENGKSKLLEAIGYILGAYATPAPPKFLIERRNDPHPTELTKLFKKRFVVSSETKDGKSLDEERVKQLTGGDPISARGMGEDFWEFLPTHKLWLMSNSKPRIRGTDHGIWRRPLLIPFTVQVAPEKKDIHLLDKLKAEAPGILNWAIEGCLEWQRNGLKPPTKVYEATQRYRKESDVVSLFLEDRCTFGEKERAASNNLYHAFKQFCEDNEYYKINNKDFVERLRIKGHESKKSNGVMMYFGISVSL